MKMTTLLFSFAIFALTACTQEKTDHSAAIPIDYAGLEKEVAEVFEHSVRMFENKDVGALVDRFTADGVLKIPGRPPVIGHDALRINYQEMVALENFELVIKPSLIKISERGDMAYALAEFAVSFNTPGGPFYEYGMSQIVFVHEDGRWKIAAENLSQITKQVEQES